MIKVCSHKAALVIEVDGDIHDLQQEEDAPPPPSGRWGRFRNEEVMKDLSAVVGKICRRIYAMNHLDKLICILITAKSQ